jgi:PPOX class probable F420-dependent enzyme
VNRREQIRMTAGEAAAFLAQERTVICATLGSDGFPHLMPLWYVVRTDELWSWTFAKSQKVRNLERDPRATLQVEAGTEYLELRGVMLKADVTIHRDTERVAELGLELFRRYGAGAAGELTEEERAMVLAQAPKRVALQFAERSRATWDHRKLATATTR